VLGAGKLRGKVRMLENGRRATFLPGMIVPGGLRHPTWGARKQNIRGDCGQKEGRQETYKKKEKVKW